MGSSSSDDDNFVESKSAMNMAVVCTVIAVLISGFSIYQHLANYTCPNQQRYIIRLLFTCPLYGIISILSLRFSSSAVYFETIRDCYESLVVYTFMVLILEYAGGEGNCVVKMQGRSPLKMPFPCCYMKPRPRTVDLLRECFRGTIQFVVVKPFIGMISIIMVTQDLYFNPIYQTIMLTIYNISYSLALYYLLVFYLATKEACANYYPVSKFAAVKGIVFATYYQSMFIRCFGMSTSLAESYGDFILCIEMIFFACMLRCAFPKEPYDVQGSLSSQGHSVGRVMANAGNAMKVTDVVADAYHNFMPAYQDYLLQREDTHASIAKVKSRRRKFINMPGSRSSSSCEHIENQLLLTGLCWDVDTSMSLDISHDIHTTVNGQGLNKNGYFNVTGKLLKEKVEVKENDKEEDDDDKSDVFRLELQVTNEHGTVPLVLKSYETKTKPLRGSKKKKKQSEVAGDDQCKLKHIKYPLSWRGSTSNGGEAVFDSMTALEAKKFSIAMSDTDSRDNQISAEDEIIIFEKVLTGEEEQVGEEFSVRDISEESKIEGGQMIKLNVVIPPRKVSTTDLPVSTPMILPCPSNVRRLHVEEEVAFSPFHSTLPSSSDGSINEVYSRNHIGEVISQDTVSSSISPVVTSTESNQQHSNQHGNQPIREISLEIAPEIVLVSEVQHIVEEDVNEADTVEMV